MVVRWSCLAIIVRRHMIGLAAALAMLAAFCAHPASAGTVTCSATGPTMNFGTVSPYSGYPYYASGNVSYSCQNTTATSQRVYICISIGTGSGGTTPANRTLASGASTIPVQIQVTSTAGQTGNGASYPMAGLYSVDVGANSTYSAQYALSVTMPQPSSPPPPGTFSSSFSGADAQFIYGTGGGTTPTSCPSLVSSPGEQAAQANFSVSATVPMQCTVSATSLAFPTASVLTSAVTGTATVSTTCNASTSVTVGLDNGATGTGPTTRQMKSGANAITYGIYRDAGATMPWGNTAGTNTATVASGTGTLTAYGRVPAQVSPPPGSYSDVVNVIITY